MPAVLVIFEDLDELMSITDRMLVIYEGTVIDEANPPKTTREAIGLIMAGVSSRLKPAAADRGPKA